jgi:hypothetical protein
MAKVMVKRLPITLGNMHQQVFLGKIGNTPNIMRKGETIP